MAVDVPNRPRSGLVRVLEADPELAGGLDGTALAEATARAVAVAHDLPAGPWTPPPVRPDDVSGVIVLGGLLLQEQPVGRHAHARLVAAGDLVDPWADGGVFAVESTWTALVPTRAAALGGGFLAAAARWPQIAVALMRRATTCSESLAAMAALAHLPRVEDRLLAVLWYAAQRFGRVRPDGILIPVQFTHAQLGRLVGSRRPTVTLAVGALEEAGLVHRRAEGWLVSTRCGDALCANGIPVPRLGGDTERSNGARPRPAGG